MVKKKMDEKKMNETKFVRIYQEQKTEYSDLLRHIKHFRGKSKAIPVVLAGPPGTGKSTFCEDMAKELDCTYHELQGGVGLSKEDIEGVPTLVNGTAGWSLGVVPLAIEAANRDGLALLTINEFNGIRPEVQISLNSLLDYSGRFRLTTNANQLFQIESGATLVVIATLNERLQGTFQIQGSALSRVKFYIRLGYAPKHLESKILQMITGIGKPIADLCSDVSVELRRAATQMDGTLEREISTRELIAFCEAIQVPGNKIETMFNYTVANKLIESDDDLRSIYTLVDEGKQFFTKIRRLLNPQDDVEVPKPTIAQPIITPKPIYAQKSSSNANVLDVKSLNANRIPMKVSRYASYHVNALPEYVEFQGTTYRVQESGKRNPMNVTIAKIQTKNVELQLFHKSGTARNQTKTTRTFARFYLK